APAPAPPPPAEGVFSSPVPTEFLLAAAPLRRRLAEVVAVDGGPGPPLQSRGAARPPVRFLARFAFLDAAVADRLHLGLDEGVENPAGAGQHLAGAADHLLAIGCLLRIVGRIVRRH